jgi:RNA-directed DNA polymerase
VFDSTSFVRNWPHPDGRTGANHRAIGHPADLPAEQDTGAAIPDKTRFVDFRPQRRGGTPQTARTHRSTSSASPTRGESRGRARTWCGKQRPKAVLLARWLLSRNGAGPTNRHQPVREQRAWLSAVLIGHYAYYGVTGNIQRLQDYRHQVEWTWHKWLERRTRRIRFTWDSFQAPRHPRPYRDRHWRPRRHGSYRES